MSAPLAPVDHIQMLQREPERSGEFLDPLPQLSFRQGGELVEQGLDEDGVDELHDKGERQAIR
jgi:hypothetical protein